MVAQAKVSHAKLPTGALLQVHTPNGVNFYVTLRGKASYADLEVLTKHIKNYVLENKKSDLVVMHMSKLPSWLIASILCSLKLAVPAVAFFYEPDNTAVVVCSNSSRYPLGMVVSGGEKQ